jgi:radical SAM superfamily enzyme YgiQ (UPF0313 family)
VKELLPLLPRPSRYLGNEWGALRKDPAAVSGRIALAFPDLYEVGMSYLGQKILAQAINQRPELFAERVFCPCAEAGEILRAQGVPLATLETDTPLRELDAVGFSLTHELCYTNVLFMLDLAQIPLRAAQRLDPGPHGPWPLVMAGGGAAFNAEPIAEFLDLMVLGDGEEVMPELLARIAAARRAGTPRLELLRELADLPGVYVPAFFAWDAPGQPVRPLLPGHERVEKAIVADLSGAPFPLSPAVPFGQAVHDRYTIELARGCTRGCRFCQAGMIYRPVRERTPENWAIMISKAIAATGSRKSRSCPFPPATIRPWRGCSTPCSTAAPRSRCPSVCRPCAWAPCPSTSWSASPAYAAPGPPSRRRRAASACAMSSTRA